MGLAKKNLVTLKAPSTFLKTLPNFPPPQAKSRSKKATGEDKKGQTEGEAKTSKGGGKGTSKSGSQVSTPGPQNNGASSKGGTNNKDTAASNVVSNDQLALDKSGKLSKRWFKRPSQFKTFTGHKIKYWTWKLKDPVPKDTKSSSSVKKEKQAEKMPSGDAAEMNSSAKPSATAQT